MLLLRLLSYVEVVLLGLGWACLATLRFRLLLQLADSCIMVDSISTPCFRHALRLAHGRRALVAPMGMAWRNCQLMRLWMVSCHSTALRVFCRSHT